jgi:hypothetical protein
MGMGMEGMGCEKMLLLTVSPEEERLPFEEGFKRSEKMITVSDLLVLSGKLDAVPQEGTASN